MEGENDNLLQLSKRPTDRNSRKSINKQKQKQTTIFFLCFSLFFYIDIFIFPTPVGTEGQCFACET